MPRVLQSPLPTPSRWAQQSACDLLRTASVCLEWLDGLGSQYGPDQVLPVPPPPHRGGGPRVPGGEALIDNGVVPGICGDEDPPPYTVAYVMAVLKLAEEALSEARTKIGCAPHGQS